MSPSDTLTPDVKSRTPLTTAPSAALKRRWARRLAKGKVPLFPVFTQRGCLLRISRGQMRTLQVEVEEKKG